MEWPRICSTGLSPDAIQARRNAIGGSDANILMRGDPGAVLHLWRLKRGEAEPDDLSDVLPVALGQWTEEFSRQWFERQTGLTIEEAGTFRRHEEHSWMACTLDGLVRHTDGRLSVFEAKHTSPRATPLELIARYTPQLTHNMLVTGTDEAVLSVLYGNAKWEAYTVELDLFYAAELTEVEQRFWDCVQTGKRPSAPRVHPPAPKLRPAAWAGRDQIKPAMTA